MFPVLLELIQDSVAASKMTSTEDQRSASSMSEQSQTLEGTLAIIKPDAVHHVGSLCHKYRNITKWIIMNNFIVDKLRTHTRTATPALIKVEERWQNQQTFIHAIFFQNHMQFFEKRHSLFHQLSKQNPKRPFSLATPKLHVDLDQTGNHIQTTPRTQSF